MRKNIYKYLLLSAALILLTSCSSDQGIGLNVAFDSSAKAAAPSQGLTLWLPKDVNSMKVGEPVILALDNQSSDYIILPADYGVRLYAYQEKAGQWSELKNNTEAFPIETQIELPPKDSNLFSGATLTVNPTGLPDGNPAIVRVVVAGHTAQNHTPTSQQVTAFIDFTLQP